MKKIKEMLEELLAKIKKEESKSEKTESPNLIRLDDDYLEREELISEILDDAVVVTEPAVVVPKRTMDRILKHLDKENYWKFEEDIDA